MTFKITTATTAMEQEKIMAKKTFTFWYNVEEAWKASFEADSLEHAKELLAAAVEDGDVSEDTLPGFWSKNKGLDVSYDEDSLEEI